MSEQQQIDVYEVVKKLVGPIDPIGCSGTDEQRLKNLLELTNCVDRLIWDIHEILRRNKDHYEASRLKAADHCAKFFTYLDLP